MAESKVLDLVIILNALAYSSFPQTQKQSSSVVGMGVCFYTSACECFVSRYSPPEATVKNKNVSPMCPCSFQYFPSSDAVIPINKYKCDKPVNADNSHC